MTPAPIHSPFEQVLAQRLFDVTKPPPEIVPVYLIDDVPVSTPGNLTVIAAHIKTGKSAVIGAMMASVMRSDASADTLGFRSDNPHGRALVHIDTEQSPEDHWALVSRALKRAGRDTAPPWLRSYCLTGLGAVQTQLALQLILTQSKGQFGGVHSVLIDGTADLVGDVNDPKECNEFVGRLHGLAIAHHCPIVNVIHFNPGSEKTRGHLGSQLERKAESNLTLTLGGGVSEIYGLKQRRAPLPKGTGPRFHWSEEAGMHVQVSDAVTERPKLKALRDEVAKVFANQPAMRYSDLKFTVMTVTGKSDRTAERKIEIYRQAGLVQVSDDKLYTVRDL